MFGKLIVACLVVGVAVAQNGGPPIRALLAARYPAGVDPQACPNYPECTNPAVAVSQVHVTSYSSAPQHQQPQPERQQPQYQETQYQQAPYGQNAPVHQQMYSPEIQNALDRGDYIGDGDYHGEGLAEALAPGHQAAAQPQAYLETMSVEQMYAPRALFPAGVDARSCPNYPYCN